MWRKPMLTSFLRIGVEVDHDGALIDQPMRKPTKSGNKTLSGKTSKQTPSGKEPTPLQLVFSFLTAPIK
jgi:hypothetical protein